jgi:hypothetical protein
MTLEQVIELIVDTGRLMALARDERAAGNVLQAFGHASNAAQRYRSAAIALAKLLARREEKPGEVTT